MPAASAVANLTSQIAEDANDLGSDNLLNGPTNQDQLVWLGSAPKAGGCASPRVVLQAEGVKWVYVASLASASRAPSKPTHFRARFGGERLTTTRLSIRRRGRLS